MNSSVPFLLWRQFAWKCGQNGTLCKKATSGSCITQKRRCLSSVIYSIVQWAALFHHAIENLKIIKGEKTGRELYLRYTCNRTEKYEISRKSTKLLLKTNLTFFSFLQTCISLCLAADTCMATSFKKST